MSIASALICKLFDEDGDVQRKGGNFLNGLNYLSETKQVLKESTTISLFEDGIINSKRFRMVEHDLAKRRCDMIE